jgi:hypothetical protein
VKAGNSSLLSGEVLLPCFVLVFVPVTRTVFSAHDVIRNGLLLLSGLPALGGQALLTVSGIAGTENSDSCC